MRRCLAAGLVDDEVAVVEGLDAEEVELEVGGRVERGGEAGEVVVEQLRVEAPLMATPCSRYFLKARWWKLLQLADAVAEDVPAEDLLVDVGELDAAGELGKIGVPLDQGLRVENDGGVEVLLGDLVVHGTEQLAPRSGRG